MKKASMVCMLLVAAGCGGGRLSSRPFPLQWNPGNATMVATSPPLRSRPVRLDPFVDRRTDPYYVGMIGRDTTPVRTPDNVALFVTQHFAEIAQQSGVQLVASGETVVLHGEITQLEVRESRIYAGTVQLRIVALIHTPTGDAAAYDAIFQGASHRWGRGRNAGNFNQALSNAIADATKHVLEDPALGNAIAQYTGGAPTVMGAPLPAAPQ